MTIEVVNNSDAILTIYVDVILVHSFTFFAYEDEEMMMEISAA